MKVGIYNQPSSSGIGGAEVSVAVLAEALREHDVEIIHHRPQMTIEQLADFAGTDLRAARLRYVQAEPYAFATQHNPWKRYQQARRWHATLSEPYDLFINFTHSYPPYCHAAQGVLVSLFPFHDKPLREAQKEAASRGDRLRWRRLKGFYYDWEWKKRMATYRIKTSISRFTQEWTKRRWDIDTAVLYPPVDTTFQEAEKANLLLSVGRFATEGHGKKQLEMMAAFRQLGEEGLRGWEYVCAGGLGEAAADRAYFETVREASAGGSATVLANLERTHLRHLRAHAKIFWHAAGFGEEQRPEMMEHFGIATVEAMAAGCVPIVINKGGQPEIVEHGRTGFLWNTLDELKHYTRLVANDEPLRSRLAAAARARALSFSREAFVDRFLHALP